MNFIEHLNQVHESDSIDNAKQCIEDNFIEIQDCFYNSKYSFLKTHVIKVNNIFFDLLEKNIFDNPNTNISAFLEILADFFDRYRSVGALVQISNLISKQSPMGKRIAAAQLYYKVNDATKDYISRFDRIISLLTEAQELGDYSFKSTLSFINYYYTSISSFLRLGREDLVSEFRDKTAAFQSQSLFLSEGIIEDLLELPIINFSAAFDEYSISISAFVFSKLNNTIHIEKTLPEESEYSKFLSRQHLTDFLSIRKVSVDYCKQFNDEEKNLLKQKLDNGVTIINELDLLYYYFLAFGPMHYYKIREALEKILPNLINEKICVFDWGCGQALATMILLELLRKLNLNIEIKKITLVEPSEMALKRGLAHIKALDPNTLNLTQPICKDLDSINIKELDKNSYTKLHLFSNIIDVPFFNLNEFQKKILSLKGLNYFVCISPIIELAERKARLENFFSYFNTNYKTKKISENINTKWGNKWKSNYCPCDETQHNHRNNKYFCRNAWTRHELIFEVKI